jgi:hypothetical protein
VPQDGTNSQTVDWEWHPVNGCTIIDLIWEL